MKNYIKGNVRRILFESGNGYKVGLFKVKETNDESLNEYINKTITFTGVFMPLNNEQTYTFYGKLTTHVRYGIQYNVENYEISMPNDNEGLIIYLSSDLFKGIGPSIAKKIVDMFGSETINEIKNANKNILTIKGMTLKKFNYLVDSMNKNTKNQDLIIELNDLGFSTKESLSIITKYKDNALKIIKENIYLLETEIDFSKLDNIYLKENNELDSIRIKAILKYLIKKMCFETGDTLVSKEELYVRVNSYLTETLSSSEYLKYISELSNLSEVILILDNIALMNFYETESVIANKLIKLKDIKNKIDENKIDILINNYEKKNKIELNIDQINAIKGSLENNFFIITGGPGTGKTTIIKAIVQIYKEIYDTYLSPTDITLLAPTGRSAKRMAESVGLNASTIHKFLKWNKEDESFQINMFNKSDTKFVIIDEVSMVDIFLMRSLLEGLKDDVKILIVGDANQLPSISPGNILSDLLTIESLKRIELNKIYRTKENSYIIPFARDIKDRKEFINPGHIYNDFSFVECSNENIKKMINDISLRAKEKGLTIDNFQVLAPMYKGENGIDSLNIIMQSIFNPPSEEKNEIILRGVTYREGDKVIQLVNDVDNNIYNGDIGVIKNIIKGKENIIIIDYQGVKVKYNKAKFDEFNHAFTISIHKSQGSEYDNVLIVLSSNFKRMLYNKLIYTAVTRAKKTLIIVGQTEALNYAIKKEYSIYRKTTLASFFR